jgi:hypothetical protein
VGTVPLFPLQKKVKHENRPHASYVDFSKNLLFRMGNLVNVINILLYAFALSIYS